MHTKLVIKGDDCKVYVMFTTGNHVLVPKGEGH